MCMMSKNIVSIEQVQAYKLFTRSEDGKLQSAFTGSFKAGLYYPPNERIEVDAEDSNFFAFANKANAVSFSISCRKKWNNPHGTQYSWNIVPGLVIVLPVTMFQVVAEGTFRVPSNDVQCLDAYHHVYESKGIIVHDTDENRNDYYESIIRMYYRRHEFIMTSIEKEAFEKRFPGIATMI